MECGGTNGGRGRARGNLPDPANRHSASGGWHRPPAVTFLSFYSSGKPPANGGGLVVFEGARLELAFGLIGDRLRSALHRVRIAEVEVADGCEVIRKLADQRNSGRDIEFDDGRVLDGVQI